VRFVADLLQRDRVRRGSFFRPRTARTTRTAEVARRVLQ
jgi:hypothetical protein